LWFALRKENLNTLQHIKRFALYYLPFVFIFAAFLYWRFFVARSLRYGIDVISPTEVASMTTLSELIATILDQWLTVSINAWLQIFQLPSLQDFGMRLMLLHSLILIAVLESWVYFSKQLTHSEEINSHVNSRLLILRLWLIVGFIAVLGAQIPFLLSHLTIKLQFPYDRFTLPFALGVSLLLAGVLEFIPNLTRRSLIAGLLAVLAIGFQIQTSFSFRADWNLVRYYLWQLSWRMPGLQPGTVLLSSDMPFQFSSDNSLTAPINWMYNPGSHSGPLQYLNWDLDVRTKTGQLTLVSGEPIRSDFRVTNFASTTDHMIVIAYRPPGCVRVLNPQYDEDIWVAPKSVTDASKITTLPILDIPYL